MQERVPRTPDRMPLRAECVLAQLSKAVAHRLDGLDDILVCDMLSFLKLGNIILARNRGHVASL